MRATLDNHYVNPVLTSLYDLANGWSHDRDFYLSFAGSDTGALDILDLGCGTGVMCHAYAQHGHRVVGVDPAAAMLTEANKIPGAEKIKWVQSEGQHFQSEQRFDLIIMTGHAFQVLLSRSAALALFNMVAAHLKSSGCFVFESRNPGHPWATEWHGRSVSYESPGGVVNESIEVLDASRSFVEFVTRYQLVNETVTSHSKLRFFSRSEIENMIAEAGLQVSDSYGGWDRSVLSDCAKEMIFIVRRQ